MVGKRAACSGFNGSGKKERKCYKAFSEMVNKLIAHEGNLATSTCQKPADKRQRSWLSCCGSGTQVSYFCFGGAGGHLANCCGCTQAIWDNVKDNLKKHFKKVTRELGNYLMEEMMAIASVQSAKEE